MVTLNVHLLQDSETEGGPKKKRARVVESDEEGAGAGSEGSGAEGGAAGGGGTTPGADKSDSDSD